MVLSNGMYFIYISSVELKHAKPIMIKYPIWYLLLHYMMLIVHFVFIQKLGYILILSNVKRSLHICNLRIISLQG
jgi:hypothetical protein